jgi:hypothetical protein
MEVDATNEMRRGRVDASSVEEHKAYIFEQNPIVYYGKDDVDLDFSIGKIISTTPRFITDNSYLFEDCTFKQSTMSGTSNSTISGCVTTLNDKSPNTEVLKDNGENNWVFQAGTDQFYQVNSFYHLNKFKKFFFEALQFSHEYVHIFSNLELPPATTYNLKDTQSFWFRSTNSLLSPTLKIYSECKEDKSAYFASADASVCLGGDNEYPGFRFAQDPSIIQHELGHAAVFIMMNQRNTLYDDLNNEKIFHDYQSDLGTSFFDEAGSINEGIADYFHYMMTGNTHVGEWGIGRFYKQSRALTESDPIHAEGIAPENGKRLSYPEYVFYDPNNKTKNVEDVHYAGQTVTHYLVALTEELKETCSISSFDKSERHKYASFFVMLLLNETLAEIGDLNGLASDYNDTGEHFVNLNPDSSYLWAHLVNPPNFRNFFQIFARNLKYYISGELCPSFSVSDSEKLLDQYGLLLFKTYNDVGYSSDGSYTYNDMNGSLFPSRNLNPNPFLTSVDEGNRRNSTLISKSLISLVTPSASVSQAYIFDSQKAIQDILSSLTFHGDNVATTTGLAGIEYNNNNLKISPGEVIGLSLKLINKSNTTMAGVQILANDWDHMKLADVGDPATPNLRPCVIDNYPLQSEGGIKDTNVVPSNGDCQYITRDNAKFVPDLSNDYPLDAAHPICLVQFRDDDETRWISQDEFRKTDNMDLEDSKCLNNSTMSGDDFNPNECLVRVLPGASQSYFGKIDPQKTWVETVKGTSSEAPKFSSSNVILMEINKWVPPGTKFSCRFRARFSNCSDCFYNTTSLEDYLDFEYAGHKPYKVLNFEFMVND